MRLSLICVLGIIVVSLLFLPAPAEAISRPGKADGLPTEVSIKAILVDLDEVNGADQSFVANFYLEARWQDNRLAHQEQDSVIRSLNEIWHPRLQFLNQQKIWQTLPEEVAITHGGEVLYRQRVWGSFSQPLELQNFPLDRQDFKIILVASSYTPDEVTFVLNPDGLSGLASEFSQEEWDVLDWRLDITPYSVMEGDLPDASFSFVFAAERKLGFYIWKIIIPLILIVMMSWIVFWINPEQFTTQIGVSTTSMLTLIAYRFVMAGLLPNISYLTRMDYFILGSTLLVFFALIQAVVTAVLAESKKITLARSIDRWCRGIFPLLFVGVFFFSIIL